MYGITRIKILLIFVITLGESFAEKMADNKIKFVEAIALMLNLKPLPKIIKERKQLAKEFADLDESEKIELIALVALELELPNNPALELKIEKGFEFGMGLLDWIELFLKEKGTDNRTPGQ